MKEIDFLPTWYRNGRQRRIGYRVQYAGLSGLFVAMVVWNFATVHSLSKAEAVLAEAKSKSAGLESTTQEFAKIKNEAASLQEKAAIVEEIDSKIDVANVLAEISFLTGSRVVLSKVEFTAENLGDGGQGRPKNSFAVGAVYSAGQMLPCEGDVGFKIVLDGVASDAGDVAEFICKLEDSPYFCQVVPLFTRNKEIKITTSSAGRRGGILASEFEISCKLANYRQEGSYSAMTNKFEREGQQVYDTVSR